MPQSEGATNDTHTADHGRHPSIDQRRDLSSQAESEHWGTSPESVRNSQLAGSNGGDDEFSESNGQRNGWLLRKYLALRNRWSHAERVAGCACCSSVAALVCSIIAVVLVLTFQPVGAWLWVLVVFTALAALPLTLAWCHCSNSKLPTSRQRHLVLLLAAISGLCWFNLLFPTIYYIWPVVDQHPDATILVMGPPLPDGISIAVRCPRSAPNQTIPAWVLRQEDMSSVTGHARSDQSRSRRQPEQEAWMRYDSLVPPTAQSDYMVTILIDGLLPSTRYVLQLVDPAVGTGARYNFMTAPPALSPVRFSFGFGSCVSRSFFYDSSFLEEIATDDDNAFFLQIGDLIYADEPLYFGTSRLAYDVHYRIFFDNSNAKPFFARPTGFIFDDHELKNNWHGTDVDPVAYVNAISSWRDHVGNVNPKSFVDSTAQLSDGRVDPLDGRVDYFDMTYGNVGFFVMDTRTFRDDSVPTILGELQFQRVTRWLLENRGKLVFSYLVSSIAFTNNYPTALELWDVIAPGEFQRLKQVITDNNVTGVFLLSGDTHIAAVFEHPDALFEVCSSPMEALTFPIPGHDERDAKNVYYSDGKYERIRALFEIDTISQVPSVTLSFKTPGNEIAWHSRFELRNGVVVCT